VQRADVFPAVAFVFIPFHTPDMTEPLLGRSINRLEDARFVRGRGRYVADGFWRVAAQKRGTRMFDACEKCPRIGGCDFKMLGRDSVHQRGRILELRYHDDGPVFPPGASGNVAAGKDRELAFRFGGRHEPIEGHGGSAQRSLAPSAAAHLVHVRVDRETGQIELLRYALAQDVGRALNPALVEGQMRGGAAQAVGWTLYEELAHDEQGQLLTGSFLDYAVPTSETVPTIDTLIVEVPAPDGPFGAKGVGEAPVVAGPAAIANAVAAAAGIRLRELPMTPPRVWAALQPA
jgi:CO/xanthine dehydrogenase Mo-binding subunit